MPSLLSSELSAFRLLVFVTVVEQRGYSAAAARLELSQPTVSFHIKALERACGVKLLTYRNRTVALTPEGEAAYRSARAILREVEHLDDLVHRLGTAQTGRLALGASINFEQSYFFDRVIGPYGDRYPGIHLMLRFGHSSRLAELVARRELDLAYVLDLHLPAGVTYEPLHQAEFVFLAAPEHPLVERAQVAPEEVAEAGLITAPLESAEWIGMAALLRRAGLREPRVGMEIDGLQARVLATRAGLGILAAFLPPYAREADLRPLSVLRLTTPRATAGFGIVTALDREPSVPADRFRLWLREVAGANRALPDVQRPAPRGEGASNLRAGDLGHTAR